MNHDQDGYFNVVELGNNEDKILFPFERRGYYTITLLQGNYQIEFESEKQELQDNLLLFTTTKVAFGIKSMQGNPKGFSCIFTEPFITKNNSGYHLLSFPVFKPGTQFIYSLNKVQLIKFTNIYKKMIAEQMAGTAIEKALQRNYTLELILNGQKLLPVNSFTAKNKTAETIACSFIRLLEGQFPVESANDIIQLKTAKDFAKKLSLHPVYLNRQVKISKGRTVSDIIAARILQEARILLKTNHWNIAEIAYSLGFEAPSHFNAFFKKYIHTSPTDYRNTKV
ncbi:MAG TPA: helix-turn-helix transcriptional regulator [Arachidicoccus sp.]